MRKFALSLCFLGLTSPALYAQQNDSVFEDYDAYAEFVDAQIMGRNFTPLILRLGGRDEYTPQELEANQRQMETIWRRDLTHVTVFNRRDLGGGVWQEARMYWSGQSYAYFYALLHERGDQVLVINFLLNSSSKPIMDRF